MPPRGARACNYATFVAELKPEDIVEIYANFALGRDLAADFKERFSLALDEEALNASHQIVVVASEIDESTSRIVNYLNDRDIPINVPLLEQHATASPSIVGGAYCARVSLDSASITRPMTVATAPNVTNVRSTIRRTSGIGASLKGARASSAKNGHCYVN